MNKEKTVFILVGAPGAGKTTWAQKQKIPLINIDLKRKAVFGDWAINPSKDIKEKAFTLAIKEAKKYLASKQSFIWDGTNTYGDRQQILHALADYADNFIAVVFTTSLEECLRRNIARSGRIDEAIIMDRFNRLRDTPVTMSEGFTKIIRI